jgi:galactokinase
MISAEIALVPLDRVDAVSEAVMARFAAAAFRAPHIRSAEPSPGAARLP